MESRAKHISQLPEGLLMQKCENYVRIIRTNIMLFTLHYKAFLSGRYKCEVYWKCCYQRVHSFKSQINWAGSNNTFGLYPVHDRLNDTATLCILPSIIIHCRVKHGRICFGNDKRFFKGMLVHQEVKSVHCQITHSICYITYWKTSEQKAE